jgi:uncharacterized ferritin-like protein (DUF455 family)
MSQIPHFELGGLTLRQDPARDACFTIVRRESEMHEHEGTGPRAVRELVHRHMSNEVTSLDIAAQMLAEFPDAPWGLRLELARQCWDESRHVTVLHRRLRELGGRKGESPISTFEWNVTCAIDNVPGRLAIQNRTFEAGAMDVVGGLIRGVRGAGDEGTAAVLEGILADEVQHVRFANRWIRRLAKDDPRVLLQVVRAVRFLAQATEVFRIGEESVNAVGTALAAPTERVPAVNVDDRRLAEFSDEEIHEILRQAGFRALVTEPTESGAPRA